MPCSPLETARLRVAHGDPRPSTKGEGSMATVADDRTQAAEPTAADMRKVIGASALGTIFEWYDFFIYGTLAAAGIIQNTFLPAGDETLRNLLVWAGFAVGFAFRPL